MNLKDIISGKFLSEEGVTRRLPAIPLHSLSHDSIYLPTYSTHRNVIVTHTGGGTRDSTAQSDGHYHGDARVSATREANIKKMVKERRVTAHRHRHTSQTASMMTPHRHTEAGFCEVVTGRNSPKGHSPQRDLQQVALSLLHIPHKGLIIIGRTLYIQYGPEGSIARRGQERTQLRYAQHHSQTRRHTVTRQPHARHHHTALPLYMDLAAEGLDDEAFRKGRRLS